MPVDWSLSEHMQIATLHNVRCACTHEMCPVHHSTPTMCCCWGALLLTTDMRPSSRHGRLLPLLLVAIVYPMNAWRDAPLFPTPAAALSGLAQRALLKDGARILDAGCGLGHGLIALHEVYPKAELHGVEWSWPLRALTGLRCPWAKITQGDMWKTDWSQYDMVYLFQRPETMPRAVEKARAELRSGCWLVSLEFLAEELKPTAQLNNVDGKPVWLYRAPFK